MDFSVPTKIDSFRGKYYFCSNMYHVIFGIVFEDVVYPSVEHTYHASRTLQLEARKEILHTESPFLAKKIGGSFESRGLQREDWYDVNRPFMANFLRQKFSYDNLKKLLLATGDLILIEGNNWCDNFWGICKCQKCKKEQPPQLNLLGKELMKIRKELQNEKSA